uniref:Transposase n=1 Tax=Parascaris univalens TaxID=6257 RepID=A0A915BKK4_PARUN
MFANSVSSCIQNAVDTLQLFGCIMKPRHTSSPLQIVWSEEADPLMWDFVFIVMGCHISRNAQ